MLQEILYDQRDLALLGHIGALALSELAYRMLHRRVRLGALQSRRAIPESPRGRAVGARAEPGDRTACPLERWREEACMNARQRWLTPRPRTGVALGQ